MFILRQGSGQGFELRRDCRGPTSRPRNDYPCPRPFDIAQARGGGGKQSYKPPSKSATLPKADKCLDSRSLDPSFGRTRDKFRGNDRVRERVLLELLNLLLTRFRRGPWNLIYRPFEKAMP